jgi:hypothetical protein
MYEEMRKFFIIEEVLVIQYTTFHPIPLNFLIYEENFIFFFISAPEHPPQLPAVTDIEPQMIIFWGRSRTTKAFALVSIPP